VKAVREAFISKLGLVKCVSIYLKTEEHRMKPESRSSIAEVPSHVPFSSQKFSKQKLKFSSFTLTNMLLAFWSFKLRVVHNAW